MSDLPLWSEPEPEPPAPLLGRTVADYLAEPRRCQDCGAPSGRRTTCADCRRATATRGAALVRAAIRSARTQREESTR